MTQQSQRAFDRAGPRLARLVPAPLRTYAEPLQARLQRLWSELQERAKPVRRLADGSVEQLRERFGAAVSDAARRLNVPTHAEIESLQRRVTDLERRVNALRSGTDEAA